MTPTKGATLDPSLIGTPWFEVTISDHTSWRGERYRRIVIFGDLVAVFREVDHQKKLAARDDYGVTFSKIRIAGDGPRWTAEGIATVEDACHD